MVNTPHFLDYKRSRICYYRFGTGPLWAICFHGYGEDGRSFFFLEKNAGAQYRFISIDLPFHGLTEWNEGLDFTPDDLSQIVTQLLIKEDRFSVPDSELTTHDSQLTLLGFSLGGRVALSLYDQEPERTGKLVLLAPDGLKVNFWYRLATQTWAGNRFFKFTMKHPGWFFGMLKGLNRLKLVNASIFKFVYHYIGDAAVREQLYRRWTCLRKLKPSIRSVKVSVVRNNTPVRLIYGLHDRIILSSVGEKFRKGIEAQCRISIIHSGHQVLHEKHAGEIMPLLLEKTGSPGSGKPEDVKS